MSALLEVRELRKHFAVRRGLLQRLEGTVRAVDGVDLEIERGETLALVGESGSGKTTLGRVIVRLLEPSSGSIRFQGEDLLALRGSELRRRRRQFQMIFQDPYGSLNPRLRIGRTVGEPLEVHGLAAGRKLRPRVEELLGEVGLPPEAADRYPHEFSGGQRQRIGIARALATRPQLVVADEPVSALDVSVQAQIVSLLIDLQQRHRLALLLIAHDLAMVERVAGRVGVLYLGRLAEIGPTARIFAAPLHPYTASLLSAVPRAGPGGPRRRIVLAGEPPSPTAPPAGCRFHPRCPIARPRCTRDEPRLQELARGHRVACHYPGELAAGAAPSAGGDGTFPATPRRTERRGPAAAEQPIFSDKE